MQAVRQLACDEMPGKPQPKTGIQNPAAPDSAVTKTFLDGDIKTHNARFLWRVISRMPSDSLRTPNENLP